MDMLLPSGIECEYEKKTRYYTCNIHAACEALTNADNMVLHLLNG